MRAFLERHRHLTLLVTALFIQLLLLAYQIKTENQMRLLRVWVVTLLTPIEKTVDLVADAGSSLWGNYLALYGAERENRRLRAELEQAQLRLHVLEARAAEAEQLAALLRLKQERPQAPLLAAEVIGASAAATSRTIFINRGHQHGVRRHMIVLTPAGIVGKIIRTFAGSAQVLLITDRDSGVGAMLADSRVQAVVKGTGDSLCRLEYVPVQENVPLGSRVLTSGQDQIYPKGLPLGTVTSVRPGEYFHEILLTPAARLTQLEYVFVFAGGPETQTLANGTTGRN